MSKWMKLLQQELSSPPQMQTLAASNLSFWIATRANSSQHNTSEPKKISSELASRLLQMFAAARGDVRVEHSPAMHLSPFCHTIQAFTELVPELALSLQTSDKSRTLALTVEKSLGMRLPGAGQHAFRQTTNDESGIGPGPTYDAALRYAFACRDPTRWSRG